LIFDGVVKGILLFISKIFLHMYRLVLNQYFVQGRADTKGAGTLLYLFQFSDY